MHIKRQAHDIPWYGGSNLGATLHTFLCERFPTDSIYIISDSQVAPLLAASLRTAIEHHPGYRDIITFPAGEASKCHAQKNRLEDALLSGKAGRDSVLIALGGGVTGDLAGYVAATLHRGIALVHMPTSLLAMVDSSIGGKVGINHSAGKNLIGAFYQPAAVFCDSDHLTSLPQDEFLSGMAEVLKYAITLDSDLWTWLETHREDILARDTALLSEMIARCARIKIGIVEADEKEAGIRSILNFGHTVGHAIEKLGNYRIKHGFAVAAGMVIALSLSERLLGYPADKAAQFRRLLAQFDLLRVAPGDFDFDRIWEIVQSDKKARQQKPRFTLMKDENTPALFYPVEKQELMDVIIAA